MDQIHISNTENRKVMIFSIKTEPWWQRNT